MRLSRLPDHQLYISCIDHILILKQIEIINNIMKSTPLLLLIAILSCSSALQLHFSAAHLGLSPTTLQAQITAAIQNLTALNSSLTLTVAGLNPFNQQQRISSMEYQINSARSQLFNMFYGSMVPLSSLSYYCQQITPQQITNITSSLHNIQTNLNSMSAIPPFSNSLHPFQQTSAQMATSITTMKGLLGQTGTVTAGAPVEVPQNNLAGGSNWALGSATIPSVASSYAVAPFQNGLTCPIATPYISPANVCMACPGGFYSVGNKSCVACAHFNTITQTCVAVVAPPVVPVKPNIIVVPVAPAAPKQFITNTANPVGLLLPPNMTLATYQSQLPVGPNVVSCPSVTPYFSGTICIACGPGQLFDTSISTCLTCPSNTVYSNTTFHCMIIQYYTNITSNLNWISINKNFTQLQAIMNANAALPYAQPCPLSTPFYNGSQCIACPATTPYFSFDTNSCQLCGALTSFSVALHSCVIIQQRQTSLSSPNLVLGGIPFNEWRYFYVNNQTVNPQLANCPTARPYYDGTTCIKCVAPTPYFSLTHKVCINCAAGTVYHPSVRQCLSSAGNIVTQNPNLIKMAAGIFA